MVTLLTMREQIKTELLVNGTALDSSVDNAIRSALRIMRGKRFFFLESTTTIALLSGNSSVALPSDFAAAGTFSIVNGSAVMMDGAGYDYLTYDELQRKWLYVATLPNGLPQACAVLNGTLYNSHTANQDYAIRLNYFKKDATLPTSDTDTSIWFDDGYDVIRSHARKIFKQETEGYTPDGNDDALIAMYYGNLCQQGAMYNEGAR
jgi:hypothetical protein